jgi:hypothetical protein
MTTRGSGPASVSPMTKSTNRAAMMSGMELDVDALAARNFGRIGADCLTLTARGRFFSSKARSYITMSPSAGGRRRAEIAVTCRNTRSPPPAGVTKPKPRSEFQLVIFPFCLTLTTVAECERHGWRIFRLHRFLSYEQAWIRLYAGQGPASASKADRMTSSVISRGDWKRSNSKPSVSAFSTRTKCAGGMGRDFSGMKRSTPCSARR